MAILAGLIDDKTRAGHCPCRSEPGSVMERTRPVHAKRLTFYRFVLLSADYKCAVCGKEDRKSIKASAPILGSPQGRLELQNAPAYN